MNTKRRNVLIDGMKEAMFEMLRFQDSLSKLESKLDVCDEDADFKEEKEEFERDVAEVKYVKELAESVRADLEKFCNKEISWTETIKHIQWYDKALDAALECLDMNCILKYYHNR